MRLPSSRDDVRSCNIFRTSPYVQGGDPGACGDVHSDSDYVVAIPPSLYGSAAVSPLCGKSVTITNPSNGRTATAVVADGCSHCSDDASLSSSTGLFEYLSAGIVTDSKDVPSECPALGSSR